MQISSKYLCIISFFLAHPEIDVVYGHRACIDEKEYEVGRWLVLPDTETMLPWTNYIPQETLFWRKRIWEKTGGYIDKSYQFAMDWELLLRFHKAGAKFHVCPAFWKHLEFIRPKRRQLWKLLVNARPNVSIWIIMVDL